MAKNLGPPMLLVALNIGEGITEPTDVPSEGSLHPRSTTKVSLRQSSSKPCQLPTELVLNRTLRTVKLGHESVFRRADILVRAC